jgi:hypothetical protein
MRLNLVLKNAGFHTILIWMHLFDIILFSTLNRIGFSQCFIKYFTESQTRIIWFAPWFSVKILNSSPHLIRINTDVRRIMVWVLQRNLNYCWYEVQSLPSAPPYVILTHKKLCYTIKKRTLNWERESTLTL